MPHHVRANREGRSCGPTGRRSPSPPGRSSAPPTARGRGYDEHHVTRAHADDFGPLGLVVAIGSEHVVARRNDAGKADLANDRFGSPGAARARVPDRRRTRGCASQAASACPRGVAERLTDPLNLCRAAKTTTKRSRGRQQRENTAFDCSGVKASGNGGLGPRLQQSRPHGAELARLSRVESGRCELEPTPFGQLLGHNRLDKPCPRAKAKEFADRREDGVHRRAGAVAALFDRAHLQKCLKRARSGRPIVCQATAFKVAPAEECRHPAGVHPHRVRRERSAVKAAGGSRSPPCGP